MLRGHLVGGESFPRPDVPGGQCTRNRTEPLRGAPRSPAAAKGGTARRVRALAVALFCVAGVMAGTAAVAQTDDGLRILARRVAGGRVELALQQRHAGGEWGERLLPQRRLVPADAAIGRWLAGSPVAISSGDGVQELRIAARRLVDGHMELALQQRHAGGEWGERLLPQRRFVRANATVGRWLASSPVAVPELWNEPPPETTAGGDPPEGPATGSPRAMMTAAGVPVAVIERTGSGYVVRAPWGGITEIATGEPIEGVQVVIDPGHGGRWESGAVGSNGLAERDLNLTLSRAIVAELADRGIAAVMTRTGDYGSLLAVRAAFADALRADALISIHHNAPTARLGDSPGTEVYVQSASPGAPRASSARLGALLYEEITAALARFEGIRWARLPDAGVLRVLSPRGGDAYSMIRRPATPAVLVEYGYLSNPVEAALFATDEYISAAATATADAVEAYLHSDRQGTGRIDRPRVFDPATPPFRYDEIPLE